MNNHIIKQRKFRLKTVILTLFLILSATLFAQISEEDKKIYSADYNYKLYPNGSTAVLYDFSEIELNEDNSKEFITRRVQKILSYKGKKEASEYKIFYDSRFESVEIKRAVTINVKNGEFIETPVSEKEIRELENPGESGFMDYMVGKMKVVVFPAVEEGSIIDIEYKISSKEKQKRCYRASFVNEEPVFYKKFAVKYREGMKINIRCENQNMGVTRTEQTKNGEKEVVFEKRNLEQIIAEEGAAPVYTYAPVVYVSMFNDFESIRDLLIEKFSDEKLMPDSEINEVTKKIVDKIGDKKEKIEGIKNYISKNITTIPVNDIITRDIRKPSETLKKGYASPYDRVALFVSMAKAAGFEAYPVISGIDGNYMKYEKNYFDVESFNYPFAAVKLGNEIIYVETSSEFYKIGEIPANNEYVIAVKKGKFDFEMIDPKGDKRAGVTEIYSINIDENGDAEIEKLTVYYGQRAATIRSKYRYMTPYQRKQDYDSILNSISQNSESISVEPEIFIGDVVSLKYKYRVRNFAQVDGKFVYFDLPVTITPFILRTEPEKRNYPMEMLENTLYIRKLTISYSGKYSIGMMPDNKKVKTKLFTVERKANDKKGVITFEDRIEYVPGIADLKEYKEIYQKLEKLASGENSKIVIIKK